jgi:hypothetical protein
MSLRLVCTSCCVAGSPSKGWVSERALTPVRGLSLESRLFPLVPFSRSLCVLLQSLDTQTRLLLQAFVSLSYGRGWRSLPFRWKV